MRRLATVAVGLALVVGACGGDDGGPGRADRADAWARSDAQKLRPDATPAALANYATVTCDGADGSATQRTFYFAMIADRDQAPGERELTESAIAAVCPEYLDDFSEHAPD